MESDDEAQAELLRKLVLADIRITQFAAKQGSLEDVMRAIAPDGEVE